MAINNPLARWPLSRPETKRGSDSRTGQGAVQVPGAAQRLHHWAAGGLYRLSDAMTGGPLFGLRFRQGVIDQLNRSMPLDLAHIVRDYLGFVDQDRAEKGLELLAEVLPDNAWVDSPDVVSLRHVLREGLEGVRRGEIRGEQLWERLHATLPVIATVPSKRDYVGGGQPDFSSEPYHLEQMDNSAGHSWFQAVLRRFVALGGEEFEGQVEDFERLLVPLAGPAQGLTGSLTPRLTSAERRRREHGDDGDKAWHAGSSTPGFDAEPRVVPAGSAGGELPAVLSVFDLKMTVRGRVDGDLVVVRTSQRLLPSFTPASAMAADGTCDYHVPASQLQALLSDFAVPPARQAGEGLASPKRATQRDGKKALPAGSNSDGPPPPQIGFRDFDLSGGIRGRVMGQQGHVVRVLLSERLGGLFSPTGRSKDDLFEHNVEARDLLDCLPQDAEAALASVLAGAVPRSPPEDRDAPR